MCEPVKTKLTCLLLLIQRLFQSQLLLAVAVVAGQLRFFERTGHLKSSGVSGLEINLAIMSIECDDVSGCSVTPKSILDEDGKSGQSMLEFLMQLGKDIIMVLFFVQCTLICCPSVSCERYLDSLPLEQRPACILWECVSKLSSYREHVNERGTDVVKETCAKRGYITKFKNLDRP